MEAKESVKNYPCRIEGRFLHPCSSLNRALEVGHSQSRSKGLFLDTFINLSTGEPTMSFVRLKLGDFMKEGVVTNFCPFCGINIRNHITEDKDAG